MATNNVDIYEKSISEMNDPFISASYALNPILFFKTMYNFLVNAIPLCTNPYVMIAKLNDRVESSGYAEAFNGNGSSVNFVLTTTPTSDAYFSYMVNDSYVSGSFDSNTNSATLASTPNTGSGNVVIEWYDPGYFNQDLSPIEQNIISCFLVSCWAEKEKNFLLDIRRLLNDDTFKLSAESTNMRGKHEWYFGMREKAEKLMNQYSWTVYYSTKKANL